MNTEQENAGRENVDGLDQFAIACVGQFAKLSHDHRPIAAACPYTQLQSDLVLKSDAGSISAGPKRISAVTKEGQRAIFLAHMAGRSIKAGGN